MRFLRCVHAEFLLVVPRLTRTRLGMTLLVLGTTLVWLSARGFDPLTVTLQAGALGAILGAVAMAGDETDRALVKRGHRTSFVATGQTGIFIEGWGIAVDAVVADFIAGAAEQLVLQGAKDNDIVLVEGQGSLIHPGYSGVTLGLLHGSCPDALILCHQVTRDYIGDYHGREPWVKIPSYVEMIDIYESAAQPVHPTKVIGICLNTYDMDESAAREAVAKAAEETGLPATDPVRFDSDVLVDAIIGARATI